MSDYIGEPDGMICPHCGLPFARKQNNIQSYRCGSNFSEKLYPQWARSMTCVELQNGQLQERIKRLEEAGDELLSWIPVDWVSDSNRRLLSNAWTAAKESKP